MSTTIFLLFMLLGFSGFSLAAGNPFVGWNPRRDIRQFTPQMISDSSYEIAKPFVEEMGRRVHNFTKLLEMFSDDFFIKDCDGDANKTTYILFNMDLKELDSLRFWLLKSEWVPVTTTNHDQVRMSVEFVYAVAEVVQYEYIIDKIDGQYLIISGENLYCLPIAVPYAELLMNNHENTTYLSTRLSDEFVLTLCNRNMTRDEFLHNLQINLFPKITATRTQYIKTEDVTALLEFHIFMLLEGPHFKLEVEFALEPKGSLHNFKSGKTLNCPFL